MRMQIHIRSLSLNSFTLYTRNVLSHPACQRSEKNCSLTVTSFPAKSCRQLQNYCLVFCGEIIIFSCVPVHSHAALGDHLDFKILGYSNVSYSGIHSTLALMKNARMIENYIFCRNINNILRINNFLVEFLMELNVFNLTV